MQHFSEPADAVPLDAEDGLAFFRGLAAGAVMATVLWLALVPAGAFVAWEIFGQEVESPAVPMILSQAPPCTFQACAPFGEPYRRSLRWPATCARRA